MASINSDTPTPNTDGELGKILGSYGTYLTGRTDHLGRDKELELDDAVAAINALIRKEKRELLERLNKNGAVIHDCGRRVDNVVHQSLIEAELAALDEGEQ